MFEIVIARFLRFVTFITTWRDIFGEFILANSSVEEEDWPSLKVLGKCRNS